MLLLAAIKPQKKNTITNVASAPALVLIVPVLAGAVVVMVWLIGKFMLVYEMAA